MVSLGYMGQGFLARNRERKQEEAQASAMAFKREQFAFQQKQHEDKMTSEKEKYKALKTTNIFKGLNTLLENVAQSPDSPVPWQSTAPDVRAFALSNGLVVQGEDGNYRGNPAGARATAFYTKNADSYNSGKLDINTLSKDSQIGVLRLHKDYKILKNTQVNGKTLTDPQIFMKLHGKAVNRFKQTQLRKSVEDLNEYEKTLPAQGFSGAVTITNPRGKTIAFMPTRVIDFQKFYGVENKEISPRQRQYYELMEINNWISRQDPQLKNNITASTLTHLKKSYEQIVGKTLKNIGNTKQILKAKVSDFPELSRIFGKKDDKENTETIQDVLQHTRESHPNLTIEIAQAALTAGLIKRIPGVSSPRYNTKKPEDSIPAKHGYEIQGQRLTQFIKDYKNGNSTKSRFSPKLEVRSEKTGQNQPVNLPTNDTEGLRDSGMVVLQEMEINPTGYYAIEEFDNFRKAYPAFAQATNSQITEFIKNNYEEDLKILTDFNNAPNSLIKEAAFQQAIKHYEKRDNIKIKNMPASDRLVLFNRVVEDAMRVAKYLQRERVSKDAGEVGGKSLSIISGPLIKRDIKPSSAEGVLEKANKGTEDKLYKFKPMLENFKSARIRRGLYEVLLNPKEGDAILKDANLRNAIIDVANSPHLLRTIQRTNPKLYEEMKKLGNRRIKSISGNVFSFLDTTMQKLQNVIESPQYLSGIIGSSSKGASTVLNFLRDNFGASSTKFLGQDGTSQEINISGLETGNNIDDPKQRKDYLTNIVPSMIKMKEMVSKAQGEITGTIKGKTGFFGITGREASSLQKASAMARGEMMMLQISMTYYYAGMVQGESGGRAISNEDFQNIFKALWSGGAGGNLEAGAIIQLEETIRGIERRVNGIKEYIGVGKGTELIDKYVAADRAKQQILIEYRKAELPENNKQAIRKAPTDVMPMFALQGGRSLDAPSRVATFSRYLNSSHLLLSAENITRDETYNELNPTGKRKAVNAVLGGFADTTETGGKRTLTPSSLRYLNSFQGRDANKRPQELKIGDRISRYFNKKASPDDLQYIKQFVEQVMEARR